HRTRLSRLPLAVSRAPSRFPYTPPMPAPIPTILFDDAPPGSQAWADLAPLCDLRSPADVRTGACTTRDRYAADPRVALRADATDAGAEILVVNARCPLLPDAALALRVGEALVER